jgi:YbbR domain-containing protein
MNRFKSPKKFVGFFTNNGSYKLVALFVTLILWISIMGRRPFVEELLIEIETRLPAHSQVQWDGKPAVKIKVKGTRKQIKKFKKSFDKLVVDLRGEPEGRLRLDLKDELHDLPKGLDLVSVRPRSIEVRLVEQKK